MVIAFVDDDPAWLRQAESMLCQYRREKGISLEILLFQSGKELIEYREKTINAVFLDIELSNENGIEMASKINELWPDCQIVYCTDYLHYAMDVNETRHTWFLVKSQLESRLDPVFQKLFAIWNMEKQEVCYQVIKGEMTRFRVKDIYYFERKTRLTNLVTAHGRYNIREKIPEVMKNLPKNDFTRCHANVLANLAHIEGKRGSDYKLENGDYVPISRHFAAETKRDYLRWCSEQMK